MTNVTEHGVLGVGEYERVFGVLDRVSSVSTVLEFKERTLEALGSVLGFAHTTFFAGETYADAFADPDPLLNGRTRTLMTEYRDSWGRHDVFSLPQSRAILSARSAATADEVPAVPSPSRDYLDRWLHRRGMLSVNAIYVRPGGLHGLIGIFDRDGAVGQRELAMLQLIGRQLSALSRHLPHVKATTPDLTGLSPRLQQVADLICEGLTNAMIARTLSLTEDTVKKYVTRILTTVGCRSRTELVLRLRPRA